MDEQISTIFNNKEEVSSNPEEFYKNYWTPGNGITELTKEKNKIILENFFPLGISNKRILEIGVGGEGGVLYPLKENNFAEGVDVSDSAILNCKKFGLEIKKANLDKDNLPFADDFFDVVFAFEVFEHFSNPQHALEEIKRVLKSEGSLLISIPTPLTYHWPRLFYPSLFEFKNFKEFLMINEFEVEFKEFKLFQNLHKFKNIDEKDKMWSWFWNCKKIKTCDTEAYLKIAQYFWEQKNEYNLRVKPLEAIEMFRKSHKNNPDNIKIKLLFAKALIYRLCLEDTEEFNEIFALINEELNKPEFQSDPDNLYNLLLIDLEAKSLSQQGFNKGFIDSVLKILRYLPGGAIYLEKIEREKKKLGIKD